MSVRDWSLVFLLGAIWGGSFLFNAILIRELGPLWVSAGRVGGGALGCWIFFVATKRSLPKELSLYGHFFILGILTYAIPFALFPLSQQFLSSGVAAIVNAMTPIMTVIVSHFWRGGENASWGKSFGVLFGLLGVVILASPAVLSGGDSQVWAIGACLLATCCYAISLNYTRNFKHIDPSVMAACTLSGATIAVVPTAFAVHGTPHLVTVEGWVALIAIGLVSTTFTFQVMYRLLPRIGATNFTATTFIAPISAIILGFFFLSETVRIAHILGMLAIFTGLLLIDGRLFKKLFADPAIKIPNQ